MWLQGYEKRFLTSSPSAGLENLESRWTDFRRFYIGGRGLIKCLQKFRVPYNVTKVTGTLHENVRTFMTYLVNSLMWLSKSKVKQFHYRPGQALRVAGS